jgi:hypothetical protein
LLIITFSRFITFRITALVNTSAYQKLPEVNLFSGIKDDGGGHVETGLLWNTNWKNLGVYIPAQSGHPFRSKADSDSGVIRTAIPGESGHFFRSSGMGL